MPPARARCSAYCRMVFHRRPQRYWRKASRTSSDRVRDSCLAVFSAAAAMSGGNEMFQIFVVRTMASAWSRHYFVMFWPYCRAPHQKKSKGTGEGPFSGWCQEAQSVNRAIEPALLVLATYVSSAVT